MPTYKKTGTILENGQTIMVNVWQCEKCNYTTNVIEDKRDHRKFCDTKSQRDMAWRPDLNKGT